MPYSVEPSDSERQGTAVVVPETADAALLAQPLRCLADVEAIERTPLDRRLGVVDISQRIALGLAAHDPCDTAIFYVYDGDVDRPPVKVPFSELRGNIDNTGALLRVSGIGRGDVVAVLLPTVPAIYWSILGAMTAGIAFPINWMLEPRHLLHLLKEAKTKAVIALGPTPGFKIWESLMSIAGELPHGTAIWSVAGPDGDVLPDTDLDAHIANVAGQSGPPSERAGDDVAIRHQPLPRLRVRNLAIFGGILQIWAGLRVRKLATEAPLRLPVSEGGFWCLVERFVFKADLANCQPATAPLELKNNNNNEKRQGKCPSDHDHEHSNTIEIVSQSRGGDIVIGCLSQVQEFRHRVRNLRSHRLFRLRDVQPAGLYLSSGYQSRRLRMGGGPERRGSGHVLVRLDRGNPRRGIHLGAARDAASRRCGQEDSARAAMAAADLGPRPAGLLADAVLDEVPTGPD